MLDKIKQACMLNGKQIREVRELLKMSPTAFAAMLGVSENTVRRWEIGDRHPRWEMMERLNELRDDAMGRANAG